MADGMLERFQEIMVQEAARDKYMLGTLEWLLLGGTDKVSSDFLCEVDEADLAADLAQHYDLEPEQVQRAFEIAEQIVLNGVVNG